MQIIFVFFDEKLAKFTKKGYLDVPSKQTEMKTNAFKKQEISTAFDKTMDDAPKYEGWKCGKVENCHTNGLSTYYTYIHRSGALKVTVRVSDHFARYESEKKGWTDGEIIIPAEIYTCGFGVFESLRWMGCKSEEYLIEKFCR